MRDRLCPTWPTEDTYLLLYTYVEDMAERRGPYREAHLAGSAPSATAGHITLAGALGTPPAGGAMVWTGVTPEDIERFTAADPYVINGLVTSQRIERWNLVYSEVASTRRTTLSRASARPRVLDG